MTSPSSQYFLNGVSHPLDSELSIPQLLAHHGYTQARVALEINGRILPRSSWPDYRVCVGDKIELVHFVGGG